MSLSVTICFSFNSAKSYITFIQSRKTNSKPFTPKGSVSKTPKHSRRKFLKKSVIATAGLSVLAAACAQKHIPQPNILLIFPDQFRGDCIGAVSPWMHTPNLDRLAREGALFNRAYTSTPTCLPARAALLTGMSPWGHGLLKYEPLATKYKYEKPRILREAGYTTYATGKMHYKPIGVGGLGINVEELDNCKFLHGFHKIDLCEGWGNPQNAYNRWFKKTAPGKNIDATGLGPVDHRSGAYPYVERLHPTHWTAQQAVNFISAHNGEMPFFVKVAFHRPHPPFDPSPKWLEYYKGKELPSAVVGDWAEKKYGDFNQAPQPDEQRNSPRGNFGEQLVRESREGYYGAISFIDEQIGRILDALESKGELEKTLILFTADHGDMMGDHHLWRKSYAYEGSARVPMIIRWPESMILDARRGQSFSELVELRDVLPTFLDAAGIDIPADIEGKSILKLLRGHKKNWRTMLDLEHGTCYWPENNWTALTDKKHKYIYFATDGEQQLFDLQNDPEEKNNLAENSEYVDVLNQWRQKMIEHLSERGEPWVVNGDLGIRKEPIKFSPNYPMEYYPV
jgi:arylsulfatase